MSSLRSFHAESETALWQQVAADLQQQEDILEYSADLHEGGYQMRLELEVDLGGGFEGGYETTSFMALVPGAPTLRFALHEQDWIHQLGKALGMQDVQVGDPELDAAYIIKTNEPGRLQQLLAEPGVRAVLLKYQELRLDLVAAPEDTPGGVWLTFIKEQAIVEPEALREIYHMLLTLLRHLSPASANPSRR
ncbi:MULTISPECIES: hypothetical protein [Hymenobacter]|uniref:DUF3137 domain-containing protein n=1 Tax=Hymenobacter mucosus TaxID=1411120 RepID=A0A238ZV19_9BACT|nr:MULTISPECIES: hypothetical protein [Hymenobacter]SNR86624.1 hypothetical protein SAMN06269173_109129 [Hymenobacter mucosus]